MTLFLARVKMRGGTNNCTSDFREQAAQGQRCGNAKFHFLRRHVQKNAKN